MSDDHLKPIRDQYTRTAAMYAALTQATQERSLAGLAALADPHASDRVLEVASGPGFLAMAFAARCGEVIGFDATEAFIELAGAEAARRGITNLRFEHGDAECLPYAASSFDIVACRAGFHHFAHPERVLAEMVRVLKAEGRILIADILGHDDAAKAALHDHIERLCDASHVRALPRSDFERLFKDAGLTQVGIARTSTVDYDLDEWMSASMPDAAERAEIVRLMESCLLEDRAGLRVRREGGKLRFSHYGAAFVLQRVR